jgi:hypothetical protein
MNSQAVSTDAEPRTLVCFLDFADHSFTRRLAGHLHQHPTRVPRRITPGFQDANQGRTSTPHVHERGSGIVTALGSSAAFIDAVGQSLDQVQRTTDVNDRAEVLAALPGWTP